MRDLNPIQPPGTWIETAQALTTFSLKGIGNLVVPAFRGSYEKAGEFEQAIRSQIRDPQELRVIDTHTPLFTVSFTGLERIPNLPNGRSCTINIRFRSQIIAVDPNHDVLTASAMLEKPDQQESVFIVENSLLFHTELHYVSDRRNRLFR
ncbi:hypothetical protein [Paraburkholderia sp. BCC1886]|uniref:hypothetical protein n=1 Tax=Paraburkholderia sp. BCC1886 TaxID=2562670 RepID=UPI001181C783|nr:hypothetical protein [Paraburkholderia sp. BCC1886]